MDAYIYHLHGTNGRLHCVINLGFLTGHSRMGMERGAEPCSGGRHPSWTGCPGRVGHIMVWGSACGPPEDLDCLGHRPWRGAIWAGGLLGVGSEASFTFTPRIASLLRRGALLDRAFHFQKRLMCRRRRGDG